MAGNVNQLQGTTNATTYAGVAVPGTKIVVPKFRKDSNWSDGFVIANPGDSTANITVRLYDATGWWSATVLDNWSLARKQSVTVYSQAAIPANFNGSALVISSQPVAVSVNSYKPSSGGDSIGSYPAVHR